MVTNKIRRILSAIVSAFTASVYEVDSEGNVAAEAMAAEKTFRQKQDYRLKIVITLVSDADKNYKVALEDYYAITIGDLKETEVVVTLVDAGKELTELYGTKVTIDDTIVPALVKENPVQVITRDAEGAAKKSKMRKLQQHGIHGNKQDNLKKMMKKMTKKIGSGKAMDLLQKLRSPIYYMKMDINI